MGLQAAGRVSAVARGLRSQTAHKEVLQFLPDTLVSTTCSSEYGVSALLRWTLQKDQSLCEYSFQRMRASREKARNLLWVGTGSSRFPAGMKSGC